MSININKRIYNDVHSGRMYIRTYAKIDQRNRIILKLRLLRDV